ncbi:MAG: type II toxin-antitoxin system prevent-host-death family antitoxin [Verrucomicrobiota bacterium]
MKSSSIEIGAFEAKTKLGELLERANRGAIFTITKHDRPIAQLVGFTADLAKRRREATEALRHLRTRYSFNGLDSHALREEGRA